MKSKTGWSWLVMSMLAASGCGSGEEAPSVCTLPDAPRFDFTEIELDAPKSNPDCPEIAPSALNTDALAEQGVCEQTIVDCVIELDCDYEGVAILGRMVESDGQLVGRFNIETPLTCVYSVEAKWKQADGG